MTIKKPKSVTLFLGAIISAFFCSNTFAADFTSDASTAFLSVLFGGITDSYGSVIQGQKSIIGTIFQYFNGFVATVGASMVFYITTVSVMNSAHSGKPLGEKWHTMFLPMRVAAGAGMLLPNAFGYNYAQVITMWFILTGVNGADTVWKNVVDRLAYQGQAAVSGAQLKGQTPADYIDVNTGFSEPGNNFNIIEYLAPALQFAACVGSYGTITPTANPPSNTSPVKACSDQYPSCDVIPVSIVCDPADCSGDAVIHASNPTVAKKCGELDFENLNLKDDIRTNFIKSMLGIITTAANDVRKFFPDFLYYNWNTGFYDLLTKNQDQNLDFISRLQTVTDPVTILTDVINSSILDQRIVDSKKTLEPYNVRAKDLGWISAGATYYGVIKEGGDTEQSSNVSHYMGSITNITNPKLILSEEIIDQINKFRVKLTTPPSISGLNPSTTVSTRFNVSYNNKILTIVGLGIPKLIQMVIHYVFDAKELLNYPEKVDLKKPNSIREAINTDPLASISNTGANIASLCEKVFFGVITGMLAAVLASAASFFWATSILVAAITVSMAAVFIAFVFYPIAIIMNVYIPLIPFVIYTTGVIGWILLCVEAMAASPIVALGLMHPNGDEVLGSAEHGIKLLLNLMLRPALMITGLIAGIIVMRISILFFSSTMTLIVSTDDPKYSLMPVTSLAAVGSLTYVYIGLLTIIIQKCFSLINEIPNKVMTWIGAPGSSVGGEQEMLQKTEGQVRDGGKSPSEVGNKAVSGAKTGFSAGKSAASVGAGGPPDDGGASL